jgi:hypothetical protein
VDRIKVIWHGVTDVRVRMMKRSVRLFGGRVVLRRPGSGIYLERKVYIG